ncbi:ThuA domain-containing protein [Tundrisphaera lichenicola]|uniref:ThuA domain-containing protein n=1 Tax=Tundrisphaera lichenicola TaxID=2029860 RepID=UPI003EC012AC
MQQRRPRFGGPWARTFAALALASVFVPAFAAHAFEEGEKLELRLRSRVEADGKFRLIETPTTWDSKETAIIVCDMWDLHHCLNAVHRETEMAPVMEKVLQASRAKGVTIIHSPSECMAAYKDHPARKHATSTPRSKSLPADIASWCKVIPSEEKGTYPIDQSDGGEDDDPEEHKKWAEELASKGRNPRAPWKSQIDVLTIADRDYISDNGEEVWSILEDRGIKNVILMGVHLNMCVLGRPFGLRQLAKNGKNVALMRDMTDTMYNPKMPPFVDHFAGTDLMVEHVEKYVAPTLTSDQILGGKPFRFSTDARPTVAMIIADDEYRTEATLPAFASKHLIPEYKVDYILSPEGQRDELPGVGVLADADLMLVSARRRVLTEGQLAAIRKFVAEGKPVVGIRTASHAFSMRGKTEAPSGRDMWPDFDPQILGGHYTNHHKDGPKVAVAPASEATHPILEGVEVSDLIGNGSLYMVSPLAKTTTPLLIGSIPDQAPEPIAWVNTPSAGNHVFYTSLGQMDDFAEPAFNRLLKNAIDWAVGCPDSK